ncbi:MAG: glycosyl hydrolase family 65 protein [Candidatus Omnitrophota bacterium]
MKNHIKKFMTGDEWSLAQKGWDKERQGVYESLFTLGNGFLGARGIHEELPYDSSPGTYVAGVYDKIGAKVADLVNFPNPMYCKVTVKGEKLDAGITPSLIKHERHLNMRHGFLVRKSLYRTVNKNRIDYQSVRFVGMHDKNLVMMRVFITPLDKPCAVTIETDLDTSVSNVSGLSEGRKQHFQLREVDVSDTKIVSYARVETLGSKDSLSYAYTLHISHGKKRWFSNEEHVQISIGRKETLVLTKIYAVTRAARSDVAGVKEKAIRLLEGYVEKGFDALVEQHRAAWNRLWDMSDVRISGNRDAEKAIRFNIYHLLIASINDGGTSSIGAKTLSGEGYRGHVFWDTEIFILPFFIFTFPALAKSLILYRYNRLGQARQIARDNGFKGAMFPWESAYTGTEETPTWSKNLDGSIIRIRTNEMEHHITADVAYACYKYFSASGDEMFMLDYGYELLFETARFWASRARFDRKRNRFMINGVIGPDEFHENVNNNAYTNMMARWNVFIAYGMAMRMKRMYPERYKALSSRLKLGDPEIGKWKSIVRKMHLNVRQDKVIEQFDGFFNLEKVTITELDHHMLPVIPQYIKLKDIGRYQILKQADVVMLHFLLSDNYGWTAKKKNYCFYAPITVHKSSLSPSVHALVASELGMMTQAYAYFMLSAKTDLENYHGNTNSGIHAANLGGTWQIVVNGFAGVRIVKDTLSIYPRLPAGIKHISFSIMWRGSRLAITVRRGSVAVRHAGGAPLWDPLGCGRGVKARIFGRIYTVVPGKPLVVKKDVRKIHVRSAEGDGAVVTVRKTTGNHMRQYY